MTVLPYTKRGTVATSLLEGPEKTVDEDAANDPRYTREAVILSLASFESLSGFQAQDSRHNAS